MNIFVLDADPILAAQYHCDKHCVKMILETAQLLSTAVRINAKTTEQLIYGYKATHKNHPCAIWCRQTRDNFIWLKQLGIALSNEYTYRYGKIHKSTPIIQNAPEECINAGLLTSFVQAMPNEYKNNDPVKAYRDYYVGAKYNILTYTYRKPPEWINNIATFKERK